MNGMALDETLRGYLTSAHTIAVLGAHPDTGRPAHYVPVYLEDSGYRVVPVNLRYAGQTLFGETVRSALTEIEVPVDIVDIFRRGDAVAGHVDEILAMNPRPRVVWMQKGVRNDEVAAMLEQAGIAVVQELCTMEEHRRLVA